MSDQYAAATAQLPQLLAEHVPWHAGMPRRAVIMPRPALLSNIDVSIPATKVTY